MPMLSAKDALISAISFIIFTLLDLLDLLLCYLYRFVDAIFEENTVPCHCNSRPEQTGTSVDENEGADEEEEISETLSGRKNVFRDLDFVKFINIRSAKVSEGRIINEKVAAFRGSRWSDCSCSYCVPWQKGENMLHLVVREPSKGEHEAHNSMSCENVIFIHGFLSSSSLWVETVFPNISELDMKKFRLFAMDLLGFGRSPKPMNCKYRLKDHLEKIESSVIQPFQLNSYHIVAHSMGCIIALALAAKHPESVKSITLVAPPYVLSKKNEACQNALNKLVPKKVWPPLLFGSAIMAWYEHLGRTVCFMFCKNHFIYEGIMKLFIKRRDRHFLIRDLTKHTHYSAWHTMHNVIYGGAKFINKYLEVIKRAGIYVKIIQGDKDTVVPLWCSYDLKSRLQHAELDIVTGTDHITVLLNREIEFTKELEDTWMVCR